MSTTTGWDLPPDPILNDQPKGRRPYEDAAPAAPTPDVSHAPAEEAPAAPPVKPRREPNPFAKWLGDMRADTAARKARADGRWWLMRWMGEQPTSVRDYLDFLFHQRYERPDGRKGWGLRTEAALIDGGHAFVFRVFGLFIGLPLTLLCYALGWLAQRPGRFVLLVLAIWFIGKNLSTWLSGS